MVENGWFSFKLEQIAFADEKHCKTISGCSSKWEHRAPRCPRTGELLLEKDGGVYPDEKPVTNNKYEKEARVLAGVMMKKVGVDASGDPVYKGFKMPLYSYTACKMVGPAKFEEKVKAALRKADSLDPVKVSGWMVRPGPTTNQVRDHLEEGRTEAGVRMVPKGDEMCWQTHPDRGGRYEARYGAELVPHPLWSSELPAEDAPMLPRWRAEIVIVLSKGAEAVVCLHTSYRSSCFSLCV
jgi:hypothetical protein